MVPLQLQQRASFQHCWPVKSSPERREAVREKFIVSRPCRQENTALGVLEQPGMEITLRLRYSKRGDPSNFVRFLTANQGGLQRSTTPNLTSHFND